jgi:CrcB protein
VYPVAPDANAEAVHDGRHDLPIDPDVGIESADAAARAQRGKHWRILGAIAVGGFAGGLARYEIGLAAPARHGGFPAATFGINVAGSFILALLVVFVLDILPPTTYLRPLVGVGFCGALTTFSTWMVDTDRLLGAHRYGTAAGYLFGSLAAGIAATSLGLTVGRAVLAHRNRVRAQEREQEMAEAA